MQRRCRLPSLRTQHQHVRVRCELDLAAQRCRCEKCVELCNQLSRRRVGRRCRRRQQDGNLNAAVESNDEACIVRDTPLRQDVARCARCAVIVSGPGGVELNARVNANDESKMPPSVVLVNETPKSNAGEFVYCRKKSDAPLKHRQNLAGPDQIKSEQVVKVIQRHGRQYRIEHVVVGDFDRRPIGTTERCPRNADFHGQRRVERSRGHRDRE